MNIQVFWIWLIFGLIFLIVEYFARGLLFFWAGISALIVGVAAWKGFVNSGIAQTFIFAIISIGFVVAWRHRKVPPREIPSQVVSPERNDVHKGRIFTLDTAIESGVGNLRIDDVHWRLAGPNLSKGSRVRVLNSDGHTLNVREFLE